MRKSSVVRGSPPKTASRAWLGEGVSPPKPTPGTGQAGVVNPHARMRYTPRSSGSVRAESPDMSSVMGGRGKRERKSALALSWPHRYERRKL